MEEDGEVKKLLVKVSKEAEKRAYLERPGTEAQPEDGGKTRSSHMQNPVPKCPFSHNATMWLLSNEAGYDMMGVAEHHLDLTSSAGEAGRLRAEGYRSLWTPAKPMGRGGTSRAALLSHFKRWDWTPIVWHLKGLTLAVVFAYFSTGDNAQAANQVKMAQILEFTHSIRTPFVIAADFNMEPDRLRETDWVQGLGQKANIVVPGVEHTCTTGRGRIIDFAVISDSLQLLAGNHT